MLIFWLSIDWWRRRRGSVSQLWGWKVFLGWEPPDPYFARTLFCNIATKLMGIKRKFVKKEWQFLIKREIDFRHSHFIWFTWNEGGCFQKYISIREWWWLSFTFLRWKSFQFVQLICWFSCFMSEAIYIKFKLNVVIRQCLQGFLSVDFFPWIMFIQFFSAIFFGELWRVYVINVFIFYSRLFAS